MFDLVDRYDLYGQVAYPKQHRRDQIPAIYRWAAKRRGLFVNPALTEPFGLTLLEAAACGLPMVATDDGGPRDILARCDNGLLVDVTDLEALQDGLERAGADHSRWHRWSDNGIEAVSRHFSWDAHICSYLALMQQSLEVRKATGSFPASPVASSPLADRLLLLDLDQGLEQPDNDSLVALREHLQRETRTGQPSALGIISGRSLEAARHRFAELHLPNPGVWITRAGTEIVYGEGLDPDPDWSRSIAIDWDRSRVEEALQDLDAHLTLQDPVHQSSYKVSYLLRQSGEAILPLVRQRLRQRHQAARPSLRCHWFLDVMPLRASRSEAIRYLSLRWGLPLERIVVVASEQGDGELVRGLPATVVLAEHDPALDHFRHQSRVYFASRQSVSGVLEGLQHYRFLTRR